MGILDRTLRFTGVPRFEVVNGVNPSATVPTDEAWEVEACASGGGVTNVIYLVGMVGGPAVRIVEEKQNLSRRLLMLPGSRLEADFGSAISFAFVRWKLGG